MEGATRIKNLEGVTRIKNLEGIIGTKNCTIRSRIKNMLSIKIQNSEQKNKIPNLAKIVKSVNIGQISHSKYPTANSFVVESIINVVDGKLMDEGRTCLLTSISTFFLFVEMVSNEKELKKGINELMSHFSSNTFLKSNKKECRKGINELMSRFNNNTFLKSKEKTQSIVQLVSKNRYHVW